MRQYTVAFRHFVVTVWARNEQDAVTEALSLRDSEDWQVVSVEVEQG